jgi:hypothetical protein
MDPKHLRDVFPTKYTSLSRVIYSGLRPRKDFEMTEGKIFFSIGKVQRRQDT